MLQSCGFIGCGNMGGSLALAVHRAHPDCRLMLCDADAEKVLALANATGGVCADAATVCETCDVVFLGVKPQGMANLLNAIAAPLGKRDPKPLVVSMAAGVAIATIEQMSGYTGPVIRIMPNTPVRLGAGMVAAAGNAQVDHALMQDFMDLLRGAGRVDEVREDQIDAASAVSGSGPAFVYWFAQLLAEGGRACGLSEKQAITYAAQTVLGAGRMMLETDQTPEALKIAVCSPGGSTLAGLTALETEAVESAVQDAVKRAFARSKELGKI